MFREYLRLRRGEDVLEVFDARGIDAAIVPTLAVDENFAPMTATLRGAGWIVANESEVATLLVRPVAEPEPESSSE